MSELDTKLLSLYIVFGFFVMLGYGIMVRKYWNGGTSSKIWTNDGGNTLNTPKMKWIKSAYIFMILFSFLAGSYLIYYLVTNTNNDTSEILIYVGSVLFLVCSAVWSFFPFDCNKIILFTVAVGAILILAGIAVDSENASDPKKAVALAASSSIVIQTFFFDFLLWTGILLGKRNKLS